MPGHIASPDDAAVLATPPRRWPGRWSARLHRRSWLARLGGRRGSVSVEFALASPILLVLLGAMVDFGMLLRMQSAIASGLLNATQYAAMQGPSVTAANLVSVTRLAAPLNGMTASVAGPACYCASAYPVTLTAATCGSTCAVSGAPPGTYVIITAQAAYTPLMPGFSQLFATTVTQTATAMLQ